jgi:transposase
VLLGVLINNEGYPFKWDVFPGNTAEVKTLKTNINACKTRFKLSGANVTLVFDRGIISDDNAQLIEEAYLKYISALDRNQIAGCGIDLSPFKKISTDDCLFRRSRPAKPEEVGRLFRPKPATQTGAKRPPIGAKRRWF